MSETELVKTVRADFIAQFKKAMKARGVNQNQLAERMGVHRTSVSQILTLKRNIRLKTMVRMVRALGMKMAIVGHESPKAVSGEVMVRCWEQAGCPRDFWDLAESPD